MDWGGTWTRASVIDRPGEILWQSRVATKAGGTRQELLDTAENLLREGIAWCEERPVAGVGIAVAGPVDSETGALFDPPNLPLLNGISLKALWEPSLGYPVWIGNDANLAALGEFRYGSGKSSAAGGNPVTGVKKQTRKLFRMEFPHTSLNALSPAESSSSARRRVLHHMVDGVAVAYELPGSRRHRRMASSIIP